MSPAERVEELLTLREKAEKIHSQNEHEVRVLREIVKNSTDAISELQKHGSVTMLTRQTCNTEAIVFIQRHSNDLHPDSISLLAKLAELTDNDS